MTNISNETRAKVIAQYIGQEFVDKYEAYPKYKYVLIGVCKSEYQVDSENVWLALSNGNEFTVEGIQFTSIRPLSALTDEEALIAVKIHYSVIKYNSDHFTDEDWKNEAYHWKNENKWLVYKSAIPIYQFFQSIGIDLPQFLLGGKTLREAGLALYQNDLK